MFVWARWWVVCSVGALDVMVLCGWGGNLETVSVLSRYSISACAVCWTNNLQNPKLNCTAPPSPMRPHKHTWIISNPWTLPMLCNCTLFWSTLLLKILIKHFIVTIQFPGTFKYWVVGIKILFFLLTQTLFCIRLTVCYVFNGSAFWPHTI